MRCDAYGAETGAGYNSNPLGGLIPATVSVQPVCHEQAVHRFRWTCEHGHQGAIVSLCEYHWAEFNGQREYRDSHGRRMQVPWNIRRDVRVCPRCASLAASPGAEHKCKVRLVTVS